MTVLWSMRALTATGIAVALVDWVLYSSGEGHFVAIDSKSRRLVDLTRLLRQLPGGRSGSKRKVSATVAWA
jgi:hypothetical protein